jgi:hypothetical protein
VHDPLKKRQTVLGILHEIQRREPQCAQEADNFIGIFFPFFSASLRSR